MAIILVWLWKLYVKLKSMKTRQAHESVSTLQTNANSFTKKAYMHGNKPMISTHDCDNLHRISRNSIDLRHCHAFLYILHYWLSSEPKNCNFKSICFVSNGRERWVFYICMKWWRRWWRDPDWLDHHTQSLGLCSAAS